MKTLVAKLTLSTLIVCPTLAEPLNPIQLHRLDPQRVLRLPVALDRLSTIRFPSPISSLEAALVSTERHPDALFLMSFQPGNAHFSVLALKPQAQTTLNVVWKDRVYVLELVESPHPWLSVILDPPVEPQAPSSTPPPSPPRLLGLLDIAKAYGLLRVQHPEVVAGVELVRPNSLADYGDYTITVDEVFRFEREDTLVFRIVLTNKTRVNIHYLPQSLMVSAGERVYYQSITDAGGLIPARGATNAYFAISQNPDGSRHALSPRNEFLVLLSRGATPHPPLTSRQATPSSPAPPKTEFRVPSSRPLPRSTPGTNVNVPPRPVTEVPVESSLNRTSSAANPAATRNTWVQPTPVP